jgi:hypothetical protein
MPIPSRSKIFALILSAAAVLASAMPSQAGYNSNDDKKTSKPEKTEGTTYKLEVPGNDGGPSFASTVVEFTPLTIPGKRCVFIPPAALNCFDVRQ